ncbi:MAG: SAM-dependent methyltransferase [Verrucomicrobiales bacterium]|nr:SAM-dependent methyltransferase [Verrucomicrobiales bacterium]
MNSWNASSPRSDASPGATSTPESGVDAFVRLTLSAIANDSFVRLVLSSPLSPAPGIHRIQARLIAIRGAPMLSITTREARRDSTRNLAVQETEAWLRSQLDSATGFSAALLGTLAKDWQLSTKPGAPPRLTSHRPSQTEAPTRHHDRAKHRAVDASGQDWLHALGLTDVHGKPTPKQADKYQQIQRYTEILGHHVVECGWTPGTQVTVVDMGCGRGALTFAAWHLLRRKLALEAQVIGIELRQELVMEAQQRATSLGLEGLRFQAGRIDQARFERIDGLIALHACDTATDDAVLRGINAGAQLIVVAPCCHQSVRPQLASPELLAPLLEHGLLEERFAEWLTDGLRALVLEWAGYRVRLTEFVASEHTPKNLLVTAVRVRTPFSDARLQARMRALLHHFGIHDTPWMHLLESPAGKEESP